jgi:diguanylate cyclase (GGDEF)-like protein
MSLGTWHRFRRSNPRKALLFGFGILFAQFLLLLLFPRTHARTLALDLLQVALGFLCFRSAVLALRRTTNTLRIYWHWITASFLVCIVAELLALYADATATHRYEDIIDLLYFVSMLPWGMLLFLDLAEEKAALDALVALDFGQVCLFWIAVLLHFSDGAASVVLSLPGPIALTRGVVYDLALAVSVLLRAILSRTRPGRLFFQRVAIFLALSALVDGYAAAPQHQILRGGLFDVSWSVLLLIPLLLASGPANTLSVAEAPGPAMSAKSQFLRELFPLLYPCFGFFLLVVGSGFLQHAIMALSFVGVCLRLLTVQHRLLSVQDDLRQEATFDGLTGALTRRAITVALGKEYERCIRTYQPISALLVDLDHFKRVNDSYGHLVGDVVLREVAARMARCLRNYDLLGRYGGEEFLIVLPHCSLWDSVAIADRIRACVNEGPIPTDAGPVRVSVSIGASCIEPSPNPPAITTLVAAADTAVYRAKHAGRDRVEQEPIAREPRPVETAG